MRQGRFVGDSKTKDTNPQEMTNMMVGRSVNLNINRPEPQNPELRLVVENLPLSISTAYKLKDISFTAYSGEVLGIAGISGSGQKEL